MEDLEVADHLMTEGRRSGGNPCQKASNAMGMMCLGFLLFPGALFLLGWNERRFVCTRKSILYAESKTIEVACDQDVQPDTEVFFSCPVDQSELRTFTFGSFNDRMAANELGNSISFKAVVAMQEVEMYQCNEIKKSSTNGKNTVSEVTYEMGWFNRHIDSSTFSHPEKCPGGSGVNPPWPSNLRTQTQKERANHVKAGRFILLSSAIEDNAGPGFDVDEDRPINLRNFSAQFNPALASLPSKPSNTGYGVLNATQLAVDADGTALVTCPAPARGCVRVRFYKDWTQEVSALTTIKGGYNTGSMQVPQSWGCSSEKFQAVFPKKLSKQELVQDLITGNQTLAWVLRAVGIVLAWMSIYCCLQPIAAAADIVGDCLNFIPCCGWWLESIFEGIVETVLCAISCSLGLSCGLLVIGIVWVAMRPLVGGLLLAAFLVLFCCGFGAAHLYKSQHPNAASKRELAKYEGGSDSEE